MEASVIQDRYTLLLRPGVTYTPPSSDEEEGGGRGKSQQYAQFLKEKERKCCQDGYVDSGRLRSSFDYSKESSQKKDGRNGDNTCRITVLDLTNKREDDKKSTDKRLKVIEEHMWQHKQEERELRRVEGDIVKNQRAVRKMLRDYENAIQRKRLAEDKKSKQELDKYEVMRREHTHKKEELTKQRVENSQSSNQNGKDLGRKVQLTTSELARHYRSKTNEMEVKRTELDRLSKDYEAKLRQKEEEQHKLKQDLAELSVQLNMEAQKGRSQLVTYNREKRKEKEQHLNDDKAAEKELEMKLARSDGDAKAAEATKRKMSVDLTLTRAHLQLKKREESRHRLDTENRLRTNQQEQRDLAEASRNAETEQQTRQIDQKIQATNERRRKLASQKEKEKREKTEQQEVVCTQRFTRRSHDLQRREHEDQLKHFQRMVSRAEEAEYALYTRAKDAEYARQKREQAVRRLKSQLQETRRNNAVQMKSQLTDMTRQEQELEQRLLREQAHLAKVHAAREESYNSLQQVRTSLREDKYLLEEHEREHARLLRVGTQTDGITA